MYPKGVPTFKKIIWYTFIEVECELVRINLRASPLGWDGNIKKNGLQYVLC